MDKGTNSSDPTTNHQIDQTSITETAPNKLDSRINKATRIDNDCKIESSQREDWIYNYRKLRNPRLVMYKRTVKRNKNKVSQAYQTGSEPKMQGKGNSKDDKIYSGTKTPKLEK